jgi:predicted aspartyl protease
MDHSSEITELLSRHGFRRFMMSRSGVGHLKLVGHLDGRPIDIVVDTGAGKTFVELSYCRSEGIAVSDTGQPGAPAAGPEVAPSPTFISWAMFG